MGNDKHASRCQKLPVPRVGVEHGVDEEEESRNLSEEKNARDTFSTAFQKRARRSKKSNQIKL